MVDFFSKKTCDRCGILLTVRQLSRFNLDVLCPACIEEERRYPDYQLAADAELAAERSGNRDFAGLGWPGKNGRIKR